MYYFNRITIAEFWSFLPMLTWAIWRDVVLKLFEVFHWYGVVVACWQIPLTPALLGRCQVSFTQHTPVASHWCSLGFGTFSPVELNQNTFYYSHTNVPLDHTVQANTKHCIILIEFTLTENYSHAQKMYQYFVLF